jgi:hypothetical protein
MQFGGMMKNWVRYSSSHLAYMAASSLKQP